MFCIDILRHRAEIRRAIRLHKYERVENGDILVPSMGAKIGGVFDSWLNGEDHDVAPNLIPTEGLNWALSVLVKNSSPVATWYVSPFEGNYTPVAGLTAATYTSAATEYTDFDESTRVEYVEGSVAAGSVSNSASKAAFTISTGVASDVLYGAAILSASAKSATTGTILAASRFSASRTVSATDVLSVQYTLTLTSS